jgi:hypothetical protein
MTLDNSIFAQQILQRHVGVMARIINLNVESAGLFLGYL